MSDISNLSAFKKRLLALPPALIAILSLPMALGLISPNRVYVYRTVASMSSHEAWYSSDLVAGVVGVALGIAGMFVIHLMLRRGPVSTTKALLAGAVSVLIALGSAAAGSLALKI